MLEGLGSGIKWAAGLVGAAMAALFTMPLSAVLAWLIALMLIDTLTALVALGVNGQDHKIDPQVGFLGWRRKATTILIVLAVAIAQEVVQTLSGTGLSQMVPQIPAAAGVAAGFSMVELLSVIRNARLCGVDLTAPLRGLVVSLQATVSSEGDKREGDKRDEQDRP